MNNKKKLGNIIRQARGSHNKGLRKFAGEIKISPTYLSQIERGEGNFPSEDTIRVIAKNLALNEEELIFLAKKIPSDIVELFHEDPKHYAAVLRREAKERKLLNSLND